MPASEPEDLKRLGERIDAVGKKYAPAESEPPPSSVGIAFRLGAELMSAVFVGGGLGWGIDWAFAHWANVQTQPAGLVVMFLLGVAAGFRTVWRTSRQIGAASVPKEK